MKSYVRKAALVVYEFISQAWFLYNRFRYKKAASPKKIIWLDPKKIHKNIDTGRIVTQRRLYLSGVILPGTWDQEYRYLTSQNCYKSMQRSLSLLIDDKLEINESFWYNSLKKKGTRIDNNEIKGLVKNKMKYYLKLYKTIKTEGFKTPNSLFDNMDYFYVCIDRNGEYLFMTGNHRLIIAKLLCEKGFDVKIPARVSHRHKKWQQFRDELYSQYTSGAITKTEIENIGHEDLMDIFV